VVLIELTVIVSNTGEPDAPDSVAAGDGDGTEIGEEEATNTVDVASTDEVTSVSDSLDDCGICVVADSWVGVDAGGKLGCGLVV
jgi:hypothetical protein